MNGSITARPDVLDSAMVAVYLLVLWVIALRSRGRKDGEDFLLAGRRLTIPAFVATLVTTWYGGILGVGEFGWKHGISTWLVFGVPYYIHAIIFALFIAPRAKKGGFVNLPDQLERSYGRGAAVTGALLLLVTTVPAAYVLMLGKLIQLMIPVPNTVALAAGAALSIAYLWNSGFRAVVRTDKLQFILMFGGFFILLGFCTVTISPSELISRIPTSHLTWHGGNAASYIALWYIVAAQTYIEPAFHQRCYAAKTPSTAKWGTLISVGVWLIFDMTTTVTALYSRVLLPDLVDPVMAFPALALKLLPVGLTGIFLACLFATIMSTVDSYGFLAAVLLGRDVVGRMRGNMDKAGSSLMVRYSLPVVAVVAVLLAAWKGSVVDLWKELGSIGTPALLFPVISSFWKRTRMTPTGARIALFTAGITALVWSASSYIPARGPYWLGIEPIYSGLAVSVLVYVGDFIVKCRSSLNDRSEQP